MEKEFVAFIKGSEGSDGIFRLGFIVRRKGSNEDFYAYHDETIMSEGTSVRQEYRAISLAVKSVPYGSHLIIYTWNKTAVNVFSGIWKAKKHADIVEDFRNSCFQRQVEVKHPQDAKDRGLVYKGMGDAERLCYKKNPQTL